MTNNYNPAQDIDLADKTGDKGSAQLRISIDNASQGIALINEHGIVTFSNSTLREILGMKEQDSTVGYSLNELLNNALHRYYGRRGNIDLAARETSVIRLDVANALRVNISSDDGENHLVVIERIQADEPEILLGPAIDEDPLTGIGNRQRFQQALNDWAPGGQDAEALAVLMIDLDRFKHVNDTLGHGAGDELLKIVASRLQAATRDEDIIARLGGDEFVVLHTTGLQPEGAESVAIRVIDLVSRPFLVQGNQVNIGASIGVAVLNSTTKEREDLLKHADLALYDAKAAGRGVHRVFNAGLAEAAEFRRSLEIDLRRAVGLKQFGLVYQPQLDIAGQGITGFEALIRWNHPERGVVSPLDFIPLAEELGEIHAIGDWVLNTACAETRNWPANLNIAINVSPIQFEKEDFVERVANALSTNDLAPERLELEITESVLLSQSEEVLTRLWEIKEMGISVAMDDFGTGYSSLSYLNSFPFSKIKIDQSFVRGQQTEKSKALVGGILSIGKALGMTTIAEGVETNDQLTDLAIQGCVEGQGYLIGRPMAPEAVNEFLENHRPLMQPEKYGR